MKENFPEYIRYSDEEFKQLWDEGIFIFDSSVLLNLYDYKKEVKDQFVKILKELNERLWLPNQSSYPILKYGQSTQQQGNKKENDNSPPLWIFPPDSCY